MKANVELYGRDVPPMLRLIGCRAVQDGGRSLRMSWGEIHLSFGLALGYSVYHDRAHWRVHLIWPAFYIKAPMLINQRDGTEDWNASYGFSLFGRDVHLNWRLRCKILHWPWAMDWHRTSHLMADGTWLHETVADRRRCRKSGIDYWQFMRDKREASEWREEHPYRYVLRSGEVQEPAATITVNEMEHRQRWLRWCPWGARVSRSIDVKFSAEVGEETGSWKGGTVGCGYTLRPGETPLQCLRRMEGERKFSR